MIGDPLKAFIAHAPQDKEDNMPPILSAHLKMISTRTFQPDAISCLPTAYALALGLSIPKFLEGFNFNAHTRITDDLPPPHCYRGYYLADCMERALRYGYASTVFDANTIDVREAPAQGILHEFLVQHDIYLSKRCIITYQQPKGCHTVAVQSNILYDPASGCYEFNPARDQFPFPELVRYTVVLTRIHEPESQFYMRMNIPEYTPLGTVALDGFQPIE